MRRTTSTLVVLVFSIPILYGGCNPCGNGKLDTNEQCDDGNNAPGDGCSAQCKTETPQNCVEISAATALAAMRAADPEFDAVFGMAPGAGYSTTPIAGYQCDEGLGVSSYGLVLPPLSGQHIGNGSVYTRRDLAPFVRTFLGSKVDNDTALIRLLPLRIQYDSKREILTVMDPDGDPIPATAAAAAVAEAAAAPDPGHPAGATADGTAPSDSTPVVVDGMPELDGLVTACTVTQRPRTADCAVSMPRFRQCVRDTFDFPQQLRNVGTLAGGILAVAKAGTSRAQLLVGWTGIAGGAVGLLWDPAGCYLAQPSCVTDDCRIHNCNPMTDECSVVPSAPIQSACDENCQTCDGAGTCRGIEICSASGGVATWNGARAPLIITYCGFVKPGTVLHVETVPTGCPSGWSCVGGSFDAAPAVPGLVGKSDYWFCSGTGSCPNCPVTFSQDVTLSNPLTGDMSDAFGVSFGCQ